MLLPSCAVFIYFRAFHLRQARCVYEEAKGADCGKIRLGMITSHEHSDIFHIMNMNRFTLIDLDSARLEFSRRIDEKDFSRATERLSNEWEEFKGKLRNE